MSATNITEFWVKEKIAELVAFPASEIVGETDLRDEIGLDSSDMMFLQLCIEQEIGGPLDYDESVQIHTFSELMESIVQTLKLAA